MKKYYRIFSLLAIVLSACSGSSTDPAKQPPNKSPAAPADEQLHHRNGLFQNQRNALNKARTVDGTVQNRAERERRAIDQQSR